MIFVPRTGFPTASPAESLKPDSIVYKYFHRSSHEPWAPCVSPWLEPPLAGTPSRPAPFSGSGMGAALLVPATELGWLVGKVLVSLWFEVEGVRDGWTNGSFTGAVGNLVDVCVDGVVGDVAFSLARHVLLLVVG